MASSFIKNKAEKRKQIFAQTTDTAVVPEKEAEKQASSLSASSGKASDFIRNKAEQRKNIVPPIEDKQTQDKGQTESVPVSDTTQIKQNTFKVPESRKTSDTKKKIENTTLTGRDLLGLNTKKDFGIMARQITATEPKNEKAETRNGNKRTVMIGANLVDITTEKQYDVLLNHLKKEIAATDDAEKAQELRKTYRKLNDERHQRFTPEGQAFVEAKKELPSLWEAAQSGDEEAAKIYNNILYLDKHYYVYRGMDDVDLEGIPHNYLMAYKQMLGDKFSYPNEIGAVFERYNIDINPNLFNEQDFVKWASDHHMLAYREGNGQDLEYYPVPGEEGKLVTEQQKKDADLLYQLSVNNYRRSLAKTDRGAFASGALGFGSGISLGLLGRLSDWSAKQGYSKAGLPEDEYVSPSQANQKTVSEHGFSNLVGDMAGSLITYKGIGKGVSSATSGIKWLSSGSKVAKIAKPMLDTGLTFGIAGATKEAFAGGNAGDVAKAFGIDFAGGAVGSLAGQAASAGLQKGLTKVLDGKTVGKIVNHFTDDPLAQDFILSYVKNSKGVNAVIAGLQGSAFALGNTGTTLGLHKAFGDDVNITRGQIMLDLGLGFAFSAISYWQESTSVSKKNKEFVTEECEKLAKDYEQFQKDILRSDLTSEQYDIKVEQMRQRIYNLYEFFGNNQFVGSGKEVAAARYTLGRLLNGPFAINVAYTDFGVSATPYSSSATGLPETNATATAAPYESASGYRLLAPATPGATVPTTPAEASAPSPTVVPAPSPAPTTPTETPTTTGTVSAKATVPTAANTPKAETDETAPVKTFAPDTASKVVKTIESKLVFQGASDEMREKIVNKAVDIEKQLEGTAHTVTDIFNGIAKEISQNGGAKNAVEYWDKFYDRLNKMYPEKTVETATAEKAVSETNNTDEEIEAKREQIREKAKQTGEINLDEFGTLMGIPVTHMSEKSESPTVNKTTQAQKVENKETPKVIRAKKADWAAHDVQWYSLKPGSKTIVAYSTRAASDLIEALSEDNPQMTISELRDTINYDDEAKKVLQAYIDSGFGGEIAYNHFVHDKEMSNVVQPTEREIKAESPKLTDKCTLTPTKRTDNGKDIWVISLNEKISKDEFDTLREDVKAIGGYYSRFAKAPDGKAIPGFIFNEKPTESAIKVFNDFFGASESTAESKAESLNNQPESDMIEEKTGKVFSDKNSGTIKIADYVADKLARGEKITALELNKIASEAFGGTMADNAFTIKDAYDAMELGVNKHILSMDNVSVDNMLELLELLPTQTKRTEEMVKFQQFSTPPSIAYLANYAANINPKDTMLEPSAGIGGIAVFAKRDGATVFVNELDERRLNIIKELPFDKFFNEDAEQINNILGGEIEPTVIVMNPPFSSSSARNMQNTKIGAKHIEQALKILAPNGRLVAIVGQGMEDGAPAFRSWWKDIKSKYNVRANIRINGKNYNKYGTNFDIQMLVIDKNGATTHTETGAVDTLQELKDKLGGIRDERPVIDYSGIKQNTPATTRKEAVGERKTGDIGSRAISDTSDDANQRQSGNDKISEGKSERKGVQTTDADNRADTADETGNTNVLADERERVGTGQQRGPIGNENAERLSDSDSGQSDIQTRRDEPRKRVKRKELTDSIFEQYQTQPLKVKNAQPHPAKVSESAAMSAIEPPPIKYKPSIPQSIIDNGVVSDVQLEAISYAGQSHSQKLPNGTTRGFFLGDGTGIGKGRTIAGMMLDNYNQGRKKSLWVTLNSSLVNDAKRDVKALFGDSDLVTQFVGGNKADSVLNKNEAIMVVSYSALSKGFDNKDSNFEKIVKWLGKDFDGLIVFDEAHKMGNATATKGIRGTKKASQTGLAGIALQEALPKARIVYSSATGATEVENLRYAERLGLWGEGTSFLTGDDFVSKIKAGGIAAMELIARDMKAMGVYLSRNISYEDVRYDKITHKLTAPQRAIYDELARSWQIVLKNINEALNTTNQDKDGTAKGRVLGAFWSSQQRFFNQILTAMQVPSVIADIEKQLADGKSCVIQLVSTNEAAQNKEFERLKADDLELDEFDLTPKQMLMTFIENGFPIIQFEEYEDEEGNKRSRPVYDSQGRPVINREALAQRDELLAKLGSIKVPSSPIDMIVNHFGSDMVAENTGRARRVIQKDGKFIEEKIANKKDADVDAFQNGDKRIIIFSKAGGTGKSYHADRSAKNQQQRVHYLLEAGWQADNAVQGFGRSHRSNQVSAPIFKLVTTDLKGQMRFISTIAKRLDQLGAMTKGQRQAGSQGMFSASDNLENSFAADVLANYYKDLATNSVDGIDDGIAIIEKLGIKDKILDEYNRIMPNAPELREVNKFLNRILSLESSEQNAVFEGYSERLQEETEKAMNAGTLDKGLENYKADRITLNEVKDIKEDERTGAKTKYYNLTAEHKIKPTKFEDIPVKNSAFIGFYKNNSNDNIRAVVKTSSTTDKYGGVTDNYKLIGVAKKDYIPQYRLMQNWTKVDTAEAEKLWNKEIADLPEFRKENLHLISGVVLPVWDKLPTENVRIYRVLTSDGDMLIGRVIPENMIDETLRRLGASRTKEALKTSDLVDRIKNSSTVYLENGWKIVQRKVSGENRIEIVGPSYTHYDYLTKKGVFTERIQFNTRYFIPSDTGTEKIVDEVLKLSPVERVEEPKYSISESGDNNGRNDLLSGNGRRGRNESAGKQAGRISSYKQEVKGKTRTERQSAAEKILDKGFTEEKIDGVHKYNLVKPEGYNDDMKAIVAKAKESGKEVGFFIGAAQRKFDGKREFLIDAINSGDNKILLRYDGEFSPQTLLRHEDVHTEYDTPEMQTAKDEILSRLTDAEKQEILSRKRYRDYMTLYKGDKDAVWEEFIADVFAGMNDYADDFVDVVADYAKGGKTVDSYNAAEYNKIMDAGGNDAVLDNIGFGDEYSLSSDIKTKIRFSSRGLKLPATERAKAISSISTDYYMPYKTHEGLQYQSCVFDDKHILYVYEDGGFGNYNVVARIDFQNEDDANAVMEVLQNDKAYRVADVVNKVLQTYEVRRSGYTVYNAHTKKRISARGNDTISKGAYESDTGRVDAGSDRASGDKRGNGAVKPKYSFTTAEEDTESLTPERREEIHKRFEKDRAGIEKPTKKQVWGERAAWVAHNMTRVFPNIPERGERGTFFAEFRKDMIQWKNLPTTASFMVQDKLNKMTEGLSPDEFKTFSELVYFLDLQEEAQIQKDRGYDEILLPNEITPGEVNAIVDELNAEASDKVKQALIKRQNIWDELKDRYIALNQYIGFDTEDKFKRKNYYHHQVIEYMNGKGSGTGGEIGIKAGRGWLKERHGSTKAINTDFLAVEYKAMLQMQYDVYIAETLGNIKKQYDIKPKLEKEALNSNKKAINAIIAKEATDEDGNLMVDGNGKPNSKTYKEQQWYNSRIMFGFSGLFDLAERGELPTFGGEYQSVVNALRNHNLNTPALYKYVGLLANTELAESATDEQEQAVISARTVLKYTAQKKAWVKETLGSDYQTWETLAKAMSDKYTIHQPRRGNYFYTKTIIDEDAFNQAETEMILSLANGELNFGDVDIKKLFNQYAETIRLMGAAYEQWVLPKEIVDTMQEIANPKQTSGGAKLARGIVSAWKGWATSVNPLRTVKFGIRNLFGDLDAVIAGNPKITLYSKRAVQEIYQAMKHKNYSPEFMEWVERGGYTSMLFANEMDTEMQDKLFAHLKEKEGKSIFNIPAKLWEGYYNGVENAHNFREAILRYSAYLYFKDAIKHNSGNVKDYVASNKYIVKGLNTEQDKAYQLSKDLLGAYDEVGKMGQTLRRYWIPFYSFTETNLKRYYRLFENIITSDASIPKKTGKFLLKVLMVNMLGLLMAAWNKLVKKDDDDELPPSVREIPHLTLGRIGDDIYAFRQLGSFSELLEWFGLDDYKLTSGDWTAPIDKAYSMITPFVKLPVELATGLNFYPSLSHPRGIRDKWQHFFNSFGVDSVYNAVTGKPTRGQGNILKEIGENLKGAVTYSYDYKESAYYEILDLKREFQGKTDNTIYGTTPKSNALYYMKTAIRYKDEKAALKYLDAYFDNGGTVKGIKQSIATLNPMYGFTGKDTMEKGKAFVASLSDEQKEKLKIAQDFYEEDLALPENVLSMLKNDTTEEEAKNLLKKYIKAKCK